MKLHSDQINRLVIENQELRKARDLSERRERIATAALQGLLARSHVVTEHTPIYDQDLGRKFENECWVASYAVRFADALIAELDKGEE